MKILNRPVGIIKAFHDDERGDDVLKNVMMLAVAALFIVGIIFVGKKVMDSFGSTVPEIIEFDAKPK